LTAVQAAPITVRLEIAVEQVAVADEGPFQFFSFRQGAVSVGRVELTSAICEDFGFYPTNFDRYFGSTEQAGDISIGVSPKQGNPQPTAAVSHPSHVEGSPPFPDDVEVHAPV
jgi:hypothetical protein